MIDGPYTDWQWNGSAALFFGANEPTFGAGTSTITITAGGQAFDLISAFWGHSHGGDTVTTSGGGSTTVSVSANTTVSFGSTFSGITAVSFTTPSHLILDNIVFDNVRAVPAPGVLMLFVLGLFGLGLSRRTR